MNNNMNKIESFLIIFIGFESIIFINSTEMCKQTTYAIRKGL